MKTYLLDTINRIKRFSESLDVQTSLCNRPWVVFNDSGDKEVLIFNTDGSVLIAVNGVGIKRTWQWIAANKSLIINQPDDTIVMLHPEYFNNSVMALNRDGTQEYAFLIDDNNCNAFAPKTLSELKSYFLAIEEREKASMKAQIEKEEKKKYDMEMTEKARSMDFGHDKAMVISVFLFLCIALLLFSFLVAYQIDPRISLFTILLLIFLLVAAMLIPTYYERKNVKKFIEDKPDDPIIPYLKKVHNLA